MSDKKKARIDRESKLTYELLSQIFTYNPETGCFYWKQRADYDDCDKGYRKLQVNIKGQKRYWVKAHRLAFLLMTGNWPENHVDHIDLNKGNNKWDNLRDATHSQNVSNMARFKNNTSGYKGVHHRKSDGKYAAYIGHQNKKIHLGVFLTAEEAYKAYCDAAERLHKEFSRLS